jgi:hypothetical protein
VQGKKIILTTRIMTENQDRVLGWLVYLMYIQQAFSYDPLQKPLAT